MLFFVNCLSIIFSINKESKPNHLLGLAWKNIKGFNHKIGKKVYKN